MMARLSSQATAEERKPEMDYSAGNILYLAMKLAAASITDCDIGDIQEISREEGTGSSWNIYAFSGKLVCGKSLDAYAQSFNDFFREHDLNAYVKEDYRDADIFLVARTLV
jgi:hypothetical protein